MVGIVFNHNLSRCPYLGKYIDALKKTNTPYEIIFWQRHQNDNEVKNKNDNFYIFKKESTDSINPLFKLRDYMEFAIFASKIINKRKYKKLIILTTLSGIFLYRTLIKKYRNKFIFDYRDASYEFIPGFFNCLKNIIDASYFTCVSSQGFLNILPKREYMIAHNFKYSALKHMANDLKPEKSKGLIQVNYVGLLRGKNYLYRLIDIFSKDTRFVLNFCGGGDDLEKAIDYAKYIDNIFFMGSYYEDEKNKYIEGADILCYNYERSFINDNALANRFYDALIFKKPLLGNIKTYSGQLIIKNKLGISLDMEDDNYTEKLYRYFKYLDREEFITSANMIMEQVLEEDAKYIKSIEYFLAI